VIVGRLLRVCFVALAIPGAAQGPTPNPTVNPPIPVVTFNCLWDAATPQSYTITVRSTGSARYLSSNPDRPAESREADPEYTLDFPLPETSSKRVFNLAKQAGYFNGDFDYKKHGIAFTGTKTLSYADLAHNYQTTYNWSENPAIDQLTRLFSGISSTIEHGRKLVFLHRFDKLGLEAELNGMESEAQSGFLSELGIIAPTLENIANDPAVLHIARVRAQRLLELSRREAATGEIKPRQ
jgi:hypothetical protein